MSTSTNATATPKSSRGVRVDPTLLFKLGYDNKRVIDEAREAMYAPVYTKCKRCHTTYKAHGWLAMEIANGKYTSQMFPEWCEGCRPELMFNLKAEQTTLPPKLWADFGMDNPAGVSPGARAAYTRTMITKQEQWVRRAEYLRRGGAFVKMLSVFQPTTILTREGPAAVPAAVAGSAAAPVEPATSGKSDKPKRRRPSKQSKARRAKEAAATAAEPAVVGPVADAGETGEAA